jgi:DNA modification methylase
VDRLLKTSQPYLLIQANSRHIPLADGSVDLVVTSPPYWALRRYLDASDPHSALELGSEPTVGQFVANMVAVFAEVKRVLKPTGLCFINLGDSYSGAGYSRQDNTGGAKQGQGGKEKHTPVAGLGEKQMVGAPWRVAFALQDDGWVLRSEIIWHKSNAMPESVTDRPAKAHEHVFMLAKQARGYYYDIDAIREPSDSQVSPEEYARIKARGTWKSGGITMYAGSLKDAPSVAHPLGRAKRTVWTIPTAAFEGAHYATFPPALVEPMVLAGCPVGGLVLDPFCGSGTTGAVALAHGRRFVGLDLSAAYLAEHAAPRLAKALQDALAAEDRRNNRVVISVDGQRVKAQQLSLLEQPA